MRDEDLEVGLRVTFGNIPTIATIKSIAGDRIRVEYADAPGRLHTIEGDAWDDLQPIKQPPLRRGGDGMLVCACDLVIYDDELGCAECGADVTYILPPPGERT